GADLGAQVTPPVNAVDERPLFPRRSRWALTAAPFQAAVGVYGATSVLAWVNDVVLMSRVTKNALANRDLRKCGPSRQLGQNASDGHRRDTGFRSTQVGGRLRFNLSPNGRQQRCRFKRDRLVIRIAEAHDAMTARHDFVPRAIRHRITMGFDERLPFGF